MQRELYEELGIEVKVGRVLEVVSDIKDQRHLVLIYFHCEIIKGEPQALQCQNVCWLTPEQITPLKKPKSDERFWRTWLKKSPMSKV